jgi:hypothetical protein
VWAQGYKELKGSINITNNNVGGNAAGSQALYIDNNSSGTGIQIKNFSSGTAVFCRTQEVQAIY